MVVASNFVSLNFLGVSLRGSADIVCCFVWFEGGCFSHGFCWFVRFVGNACECGVIVLVCLVVGYL